MKRAKSLLFSLAVAAGLATMASATVFADSSLKELNVSYENEEGKKVNVNLTPGFSSDETEYKATVKNSGKTLDIDAVATESTANVKISWNVLDEGDNETYVDVTDSTGDKTRYTIYTKRLTVQESETYVEEEPDTKESDVTVKVNKIPMTIASKIKKSDIPEGFEESTYTYKNEEFPCIKGKVKQLTALYLSNKEEEIEGFYIYNEEKDSFYAMRNILIKSRMYTIVSPDKKDACLKSYSRKKVMIQEQEVRAWELDAEERLYLVYAMNWDGDINLYCYDDQEKVFQRYIATNDVNTQLEAANTSYGKLQDKYNTIVDRYNILVKIIAGLVILIVVFIFVILNLILANKTKKIKKGGNHGERPSFGMDVEEADIQEEEIESDRMEEERNSEEMYATQQRKEEEEEIEEAILAVNEDLKLAVAMETGVFEEDPISEREDQLSENIPEMEPSKPKQPEKMESIFESIESVKQPENTQDKDMEDDDDFVFVD